MGMSIDEKFQKGIFNLLEECKKEYGVERTLTNMSDPFSRGIATAYFENNHCMNKENNCE